MELKNWFNEQLYQDLADLITSAYPNFPAADFYKDVLENLENLTLKERLRQTTVTCHRYLPSDYRTAVQILYQIAPQIHNGFVGMFLPDFVGLYGQHDLAFSLDALKYFTLYSSSEFAIREFLKSDFPQTMGTMINWSQDQNQHVRRLASEGSRPRLPWSFQLDNLIADPTPVQPILENLKADPQLYVRKSVANHLNDISKDHPDWMLDLASSWDQSNRHTAWIIKHASRTLIKAGHPRAFALFEFEADPQTEITNFTLSDAIINLGQSLTFSFDLQSHKDTPQKLVVDYKIHYVKKNGQTKPKVFKLKEITLPAKKTLTLSKKQLFKNFSTRVHYPGLHTIELLVNGHSTAKTTFKLIT